LRVADLEVAHQYALDSGVYYPGGPTRWTTLFWGVAGSLGWSPNRRLQGRAEKISHNSVNYIINTPLNILMRSIMSEEYGGNSRKNGIEV